MPLRLPPFTTLLYSETHVATATSACTRMQLSRSRPQGSILVWTIMTIAILSLLAAEVIRLVSLKYQSALQTATWQEALLAAESGVDLGIVELRKSLFPAPNNAWSGWNNIPGN